ncbi:hypothetical protein U9M48_011424 [Paspalum notatum var. saurae]|uniref:Uncharacterized protein n=1 Tax=Paspalum notatum var. saurae TaxID=547442 RepID=A0AAQ3WHC2_PASNO
MPSRGSIARHLPERPRLDSHTRLHAAAASPYADEEEGSRWLDIATTDTTAQHGDNRLIMSPLQEGDVGQKMRDDISTWGETRRLLGIQLEAVEKPGEGLGGGGPLYSSTGRRPDSGRGVSSPLQQRRIESWGETGEETHGEREEAGTEVGEAAARDGAAGGGGRRRCCQLEIIATYAT